MAEKKRPIAEQVMEIAAPIAEQMGYSLWDVFYGKEGQNLVLRLVDNNRRVQTNLDLNRMKVDLNVFDGAFNANH